MIEKEYIGRLEKELNKFGYKNLIFEKIEYGINSSSWKVLSNNQKYFLKFYLSEKGDQRDRFGSELRFAELLKEGGFNNFPKIILSNRFEKWSLFEWIEGEKVTNPKENDFEQLIIFLKEIQILQNHSGSKKIGKASEACFNLIDHKNLISMKLENIINSSNIFLSKWLTEEVLGSLKKCEDTYKNYFSNDQVRFANQKKILSPSDIGFHNIIKKKDVLFFHDFEYSGWDDPYKLVVDLFIQPENVLDKDKCIKIFESLKDFFFLEDNFNYLKIYLILYRAKWVSIILKKIIDKNLEHSIYKKTLMKSYRYFYLVGDIWDL